VAELPVSHVEQEMTLAIPYNGLAEVNTTADEDYNKGIDEAAALQIAQVVTEV